MIEYIQKNLTDVLCRFMFVEFFLKIYYVNIITYYI